MEKIIKSEAEWRAELDPVQYHVLREAGTERAFAGKLTDESAKASFAAPDAARPYLHLIPNLTAARAGQALPHLQTVHPLMSTWMSHTAWSAPRCVVRRVKGIWGMYFPMVPGQPGCATASTAQR